MSTDKRLSIRGYRYKNIERFFMENAVSVSNHATEAFKSVLVKLIEASHVFEGQVYVDSYELSLLVGSTHHHLLDRVSEFEEEYRVSHAAEGYEMPVYLRGIFRNEFYTDSMGRKQKRYSIPEFLALDVITSSRSASSKIIKAAMICAFIEKKNQLVQKWEEDAINWNKLLLSKTERQKTFIAKALETDEQLMLRRLRTLNTLNTGVSENRKRAAEDSDHAILSIIHVIRLRTMYTAATYAAAELLWLKEEGLAWPLHRLPKSIPEKRKKALVCLLEKPNVITYLQDKAHALDEEYLGRLERPIRGFSKKEAIAKEIERRKKMRNRILTERKELENLISG